MLETEDVQHITKLWQVPPTENIRKDASKVIQQFNKSDSLAIYCAGISALALATGDAYYRQLATVLYEVARERDLSIESLLPWHVPENGISDHVYSIEEAAQFVSQIKEKKIKVGFLHGHYRLLTPANWANVLVAREHCDLLILGLEDGWRTKKYKGVEPVARDWVRHQWILASGFDGKLVRISRSSYNNLGYRNILQKINPDIYFGNVSVPFKAQQEMEARAALCSVAYISLMRQPGFSTSEFLGKNLN